MVAFRRKPAAFFSQKLIELLERRDHPCPVSRWLDFIEQLDALEVEALSDCAPDQILFMIRLTREIVEFAEITVRQRRPETARLVDILTREMTPRALAI